MIPVGVGNNSTPINVLLLQNSWEASDCDVSHFCESSKDFDTTSEEIIWPPTPDCDRDNEASDEGAEAGNVNLNADVEIETGSEIGRNGEGEGAQIGDKRKGKGKDETNLDLRLKKHVKVEKKPMVGPHPGKSTPAAASQKKTAKSAIDKFSEIAAREEETTQKVIEFKKTKLRAYSDKEIAKVKSKKLRSR